MNSVRVWCALSLGDGRAVIEELRVWRGSTSHPYLRSLGIDGISVSLPHGVVGRSYELAMVLGALALEYSWDLDRFFVASGAVAEDGAVERVGYLPEKMQAAHAFGLRRFLYPRLVGDLDSNYVRAVALRKRELGLQGVACIDVAEAVRAVVSPVDRFLGVFGAEVDGLDLLGALVRNGDQAALVQLLLKWLTGSYPSGVGRTLYGSLLAVPSVIREERFRFPLIKRGRLLALTASVSDPDVELLFFANAGDFTFEESVAEFETVRSTTELDSLESFLVEALRSVDSLLPYDEARATFSYPQAFVSSDELWEVLRAFSVHVSRFLGETDLVSVEDDLRSLLFAEFPDFEAALALGVRVVLDRLTDRLKREALVARNRRLLMRAVLPLSVSEERRLAERLADRFGVTLPGREVDRGRLAILTDVGF